MDKLELEFIHECMNEHWWMRTQSGSFVCVRAAINTTTRRSWNSGWWETRKTTRKKKKSEQTGKQEMQKKWQRTGWCMKMLERVNEWINQWIMWMIKKPKKKKANNTRCSRAVTHHSTNPARLRLTSVIGREPVHSQWYDRWRKLGALLCLMVALPHPHNCLKLHVFLAESPLKCAGLVWTIIGSCQPTRRVVVVALVEVKSMDLSFICCLSM